MKKKTSKNVTGVFWRPLAYSLAIVLLVVSAVQISRIASVASRMGAENERVISEFHEVKEAVIQYGNDLNEIRDYLYLPTQEYHFFEKKPASARGGSASGGEDEAQDKPPLSAIYNFAEDVGQTYLDNKNRKTSEQWIRSLKTDQAFRSELYKLGLLPARYFEDTADHLIFKFYLKKEPLAQLIFNKNSADFHMQSILGLEPVTLDSHPLKEAVIDFLTDQKGQILNMKQRLPKQKEMIKRLWEKESISNLLKEKQLQLTLNPVEIESGFEYTIQNQDSEPLLTVLLDRKNGEFVLNGVSYADIAALEPSLTDAITPLNGETDRFRLIGEQKTHLQALFKEPAFQAALSVTHLALKPMREEGEQLIYDLVNTEDETLLGSIIFETKTGNIKLRRASNGEEVGLEGFLENGSKKNN